MNRRALLDALTRTGMAAVLSPVLTRTVPGAPATRVLTQPLPPVSLADWAMTAVEVTYAPGEVDSAHRHPGFVFGYVLDGTLRFRVDGHPETVYHAGQMFYEAPGSVHRVSANASATAPCRFLAMVFADNNSPISAPA
jgi:quercetin dioxygenase-like cupin family protein